MLAQCEFDECEVYEVEVDASTFDAPRILARLQCQRGALLHTEGARQGTHVTLSDLPCAFFEGGVAHMWERLIDARRNEQSSGGYRRVTCTKQTKGFQVSMGSKPTIELGTYGESTLAAIVGIAAELDPQLACGTNVKSWLLWIADQSVPSYVRNARFVKWMVVNEFEHRATAVLNVSTYKKFLNGTGRKRGAPQNLDERPHKWTTAGENDNVNMVWRSDPPPTITRM